MSIIGDIVSAIFGTSKKSRAQVEKELSAIGNQRGLDPLHSIVDLQKALDLDSDLKSRKLAWAETGAQDEYKGSAAQNHKLHAFVMAEIEKGCIDVPDKE